MSESTESMPTLSLLSALRGACIAHHEAAADAVKYNQRMKSLITELIGRVENGEVQVDVEDEINRLKGEVDRLKAENTRLLLDSADANRKSPADGQKAYDVNELVESMQALRSFGHTWKSIAARLNERGHRTKSGKLWTDDYANMVYKRNGGGS